MTMPITYSTKIKLKVFIYVTKKGDLLSCTTAVHINLLLVNSVLPFPSIQLQQKCFRQLLGAPFDPKSNPHCYITLVVVTPLILFILFKIKSLLAYFDCSVSVLTGGRGCLSRSEKLLHHFSRRTSCLCNFYAYLPTSFTNARQKSFMSHLS